MKSKIVFISALAALLLTSCGTTTKTHKSATNDMEQTNGYKVNALTAEEKEKGWMLLFDGESLSGWRGYGKEGIPSAWSVDGDAIRIKGSGEGEAGAEDGGDIIYDQKFKNFELQFEWKVSKGGNSGVFYLAREIDGLPIYRSAPEYQILDNENHLDARLGVNNNRQSASLYDLIPAVPQNAKPFNEWNTGGIVVYKGTVIHMQNGANVLEYHLWTPEWEEMIENSKFKGWSEMINAGGEERQGYIGLQDHGDDVWFRNIKLKVLD